MLHDVFISYARNDQQAAEAYHRFLTDQGLDVWYDRLTGADRPVFEAIELALRRSSFMLLLWSKHAAGADFVRQEVFLAQELGKKIIPVKLDNRGFPVGIKIILTGTKPIDGRRAVPEDELADLAHRIAPRPSGRIAPVFLLLNMKGGVGKTTLAANLAGTFHNLDMSVLLVDLDAQANLSNLLMSEQQYVEAVTFDRSVISCFENSLAGNATTSAVEHLFEISSEGPLPKPTQLAFNLRNPLVAKRFDLIVGQFELFKYSLSRNYPGLASCGERFTAFLDQAKKQYDVIVLDAAPSNSFITECAITAASDIVAPTTPDKYALRGIQAISRLMSEGMNLHPCKPVHVVLNNVPAEVSDAERTITDAYPLERIDARVRDSSYFAVKNADPNVRVRDPLAELAYMKAKRDVKGVLQEICEELLRRNELESRNAKPPQTS